MNQNGFIGSSFILFSFTCISSFQRSHLWQINYRNICNAIY